jgi:hypothetical protein
MAVYGPVRHQKMLKLRSIYYFFGDGPVHILPYDPQCHELFAIYIYFRFKYKHIKLILIPLRLYIFSDGFNLIDLICVFL